MDEAIHALQANAGRLLARLDEQQETITRQGNVIENLEIRVTRTERQLLTWWDAWGIVQEVLDDAEVPDAVQQEVKAALRRYAGSDEGAS